MTANKDIIEFTLSGRALDKKDLFGKSGTADPFLKDDLCEIKTTTLDPYFVLYRLTSGNERVKCFQSEIIKNTLDPNWKVGIFLPDDCMSKT